MAERNMVPTAAFLERHEFIHNLWVQGFKREPIVREARNKFQLGRNATLKLLERVKEEAVAQSAADRASNKARQEARLLSHIQKARVGEVRQRVYKLRGADGKLRDELREEREIKWGAVESLENLLAEIQGNKAPLQVNVDVTVQAAVVQVLSSMSPEQIDGLVERYAELERKAQLYDVVAMPEPPKKLNGGGNGAP